MTQFAVFSIHVPAVELVGDGYTHDGKHIIRMGEPLHVADSREEAEEWRAARKAQPLAPSSSEQ